MQLGYIILSFDSPFGVEQVAGATFRLPPHASKALPQSIASMPFRNAASHIGGKNFDASHLRKGLGQGSLYGDIYC